MKMYMKGLLALLLGLLGALPLLGGDNYGDACGGGGENGVWILPNRSHLNSGSGTGSAGQCGDPLAQALVSDITHSFVMQASGNVGHLVATLSNANLGTHGVSVCGSQITLSSQLMVAISQLPNSRCDLLVIDENYCGYVMSLVFDANRRLRIYVY